MKLLLDTHIFLWYIAGRPRLPADLLSMIRDPENAVYLSVVSLWEIMVKYHLGKLPMPQPPGVYIPQQRQQHQFESLPLDEDSITNLSKLPAHHKDPFDRMLICQAIQHGLTLISTDKTVQAYADHVPIRP